MKAEFSASGTGTTRDIGREVSPPIGIARSGSGLMQPSVRFAAPPDKGIDTANGTGPETAVGAGAAAGLGTAAGAGTAARGCWAASPSLSESEKPFNMTPIWRASLLRPRDRGQVKSGPPMESCNVSGTSRGNMPSSALKRTFPLTGCEASWTPS